MSLFYVITKIHQVYVNYLKLWLFAALYTLGFGSCLTILNDLSTEANVPTVWPAQHAWANNKLEEDWNRLQFFYWKLVSSTVFRSSLLLFAERDAWAERYLFDTTLRHYLQDELDNCDTAPSKWYDLKLETTDFSLTIWVAPTLHEPGFPKPSDTAMIFH